MVTAIVLIKAETDQVSELAQALAAVKGVTEVFSVAGRWDLVVMVKVSGHEDLATVVTDRIRKLHGVRRSETLIAFRAYSNQELAAAYAIGID